VSTILACSTNFFDRYGYLEVENNTPYKLQVKSRGIHFYLDPDTGEKVDVNFGILFDLDPFKKKRIEVRIGPHRLKVISLNKFEKEYDVNVYEGEVGAVIVYE
jgi:aromatic ring-opening dioxygenase LigB subunit